MHWRLRQCQQDNSLLASGVGGTSEEGVSPTRGHSTAFVARKQRASGYALLKHNALVRRETRIPIGQSGWKVNGTNGWSGRKGAAPARWSGRKASGTTRQSGWMVITPTRWYTQKANGQSGRKANSPTKRDGQESGSQAGIMERGYPAHTAMQIAIPLGIQNLVFQP